VKGGLYGDVSHTPVIVSFTFGNSNCHSKTMYGQISPLAGIFSRIYRMPGCILVKVVIFYHFQVHIKPITFSRSWD